MSALAEKESLTRKDKLIPWYFVMFFGVVVAVNITMATLAIKTNSGLVTDHPYEKGIAYNQVVDAETAQEALGWKADIEYASGTLSFALHDAKGKAVATDKVTAHITRPAQEGMDFDLTLENGSAHVKFPLPGLWEIRIFAQSGTHTYQQSKRIVVK